MVIVRVGGYGRVRRLTPGVTLGVCTLYFGYNMWGDCGTGITVCDERRKEGRKENNNIQV